MCKEKMIVTNEMERKWLWCICN